LRIILGEENMKGKKERKPKYRKVKAWVKTATSTYTGNIYLPPKQGRFSDVMNDKRKFISMTDVESKDFAEPKSFLAINKDSIELVEVIEPKEE